MAESGPDRKENALLETRSVEEEGHNHLQVELDDGTVISWYPQAMLPIKQALLKVLCGITMVPLDEFEVCYEKKIFGSKAIWTVTADIGHRIKVYLTGEPTFNPLKDLAGVLLKIRFIPEIKPSCLPKNLENYTHVP